MPGFPGTPNRTFVDEPPGLPGGHTGPSAPANRTIVGGGQGAPDGGMWATIPPTARPGQTIRGTTTTEKSSRKTHLLVRPRALTDSSRIKQGGPRPGDSGSIPLGADYELLEILGEGGMGIVYAARQASIDRVVAIKMLKPEMAEDDSLRDKFLVEAAVTGDLDHPNIVAIHEMGSNESGSLFYSMRRVRGTPWLDVIQKKTLAENFDIFMRVCDAVAFAHSKGVIHRDLKPENTMLGDFGETLVMDWGLALTVFEHGKADSIFASDSLAGTPAYMAPEMAIGPVSRLGFTSDVYLLGAILFEIITGSPPHVGDTATECLYSVGRNLIQPTEKKGELLDIALKAMATDQNERYQTVLELQAAVRAYQSHSESIALSARAEQDLARARKSNSYDDYAQSLFGFKEAHELWTGNTTAKEGLSVARLAYGECAFRKDDLDLAVSLLTPDEPTHAPLLKNLKAAREERDARQRRLMIGTYVVRGLVAAIMVILLGGAYWINNERLAANSERNNAVEAKKNAVLAQADAEKARDQSKESETKAKSSEKKAKVSEGVAKSAQKDAEISAEQAKRSEADALDQKKKAELARIEAENLRIKSDREAYTALVALTSEKILENNHGQARELLASCREELRQWEWGRLQFECDLHSQALNQGAPVNSVSFSSNGQFAMTGGWNGARIWDAASNPSADPVTKNKPLVTLEDGVEVYWVEFSPHQDPHGRPRLAVTVSKDESDPIKLWDLNWDAVKATRHAWNGNQGAQRHTKPALFAVFSPKGDLLLSGGEDKSARLWEVTSGHLIGEPLRGHYEAISCAAFSPDESQIVTASFDGSANVWTRQSFTDDNGDGRMTIEEFRAGREAKKSQTLRDAERVQAIKDTASTLALVKKADKDANGSLSLVEFNAAPELWFSEPLTFRGHSGPIHAVAFSRDGQYVVTGSEDKTAIVWRPDAEQPFNFAKLIAHNDKKEKLPELPRRLMLAGHSGAVRSVAFSPNGREVLTASEDNTINIWDLREKETVQSPEDWDKEVARNQPSGKTGNIVQSLRGNDYVREEGRVLTTLRGHGSSVHSAVFSADGQSVLTGSYDKEAKIWSRAGYIDGRRVLRGHLGSVVDGNFSPDSQRVVTASKDGTSRTWFVADGTLEHRLAEGHAYLLTTVGISRDGRRVVTGAGDRTVRVWNLASGTELLRVENTGRTGAAAISSAGDFVVTGSQRPKGTDDDKILAEYDEGLFVKVWDVESAKEPRAVLKGHPAKVSAVAISADDSKIASGDERGVTLLWDSKTSKLLGTFQNHSRKVSAIAFSEDGSQLFTASADKTVLCRDTSGNVRFALKHPDSVTALAVSSMFVLTGSSDGKARFWDINGQPTEWVFDVGGVQRSAVGGEEVKISVSSVAFSRDGLRALAVSSDNKVRMWELAKVSNGLQWKKIGSDYVLPKSRAFEQAAREARTSIERLKTEVQGLEKNAAGLAEPKKAALVGEIRDKHAQIAQFQMIYDQYRTDHENDRAVWVAVFAPSGNQMLTGGGRDAQVWDIANLDNVKFVRRFASHGVVSSAVYSHDGEHILTGSYDQTGKLWDTAAGQAIAKLVGGHTKNINDVTFAPDGQYAFTAGDDQVVRRWKMSRSENGQWEAALDPLANEIRHEDRIRSVAIWSPKDHPHAPQSFPPMIVTASNDKTAKIWNADTGELIATLAGHTYAVLSAAFAPNGQSVVTTSEDNTALIWDRLSPAKPLHTLSAHTAFVNSAVFSPDGVRLLTGSDDSKVKLWDVTTGKEILTLGGHTEGVTSVSFAPDGKTVLTTSDDGTAILWPVKEWKSKKSDSPSRAPLARSE